MRFRYAPLLGLLACSELKGVAPSDAGTDAAPLADAGADGARVDAGPLPDSPPDSACTLAADPWSKATKSDPRCEKRNVYLLESWSSAGAPPEVLALSIARGEGGRVGIAVNGITDIEQGDLRIRTFSPTSPTFPLPVPLVKVPSAPFENVGAGVRIVAGNDDTFHLVYQRDVSQAGGSIVYRRLPASNVLGPEQAVMSVGHGTQLGIAVSPKTSDVLISYFVPPTAAIAGELTSRLRVDATQVFGAPVPIQGSFAKDGAAGNGAHALRFDATGAAHVAYHLSQTPSSALPRYAISANGLWAPSKSLDNNRFDGLAGYSISLAIDDQLKYAAYYYRATGETTAELRVAKWSLDNDVPAIETRDKGIIADDPTAPRYAASMAVDKYGLLHIAYVRPISASQCQISYQRQTRKQGQTAWLEDGIAPAFPCLDQSSIAIAMLVDETARPHIAYAITGAGLYYATRF
jgi:hypothetical protein